MWAGPPKAVQPNRKNDSKMAKKEPCCCLDSGLDSDSACFACIETVMAGHRRTGMRALAMIASCTLVYGMQTRVHMLAGWIEAHVP